ncbi:hypothetical protein B0H10DRAFT_2062226 [Mycena sp. CBHHK59/15]|nr:hypothetical protein B0H10DRAFT_2062226 [Mycena sp. CBHHK59/15]
MALHDLSKVLNPLFYGVFVSTGLWGITVVQTWKFFNSTRNEWILRTFVGLVFAADTALTCVTSSIVQYYLVQSFGNIIAIVATKPTSFAAELAINLVIVTLVGFFLAHRVFLARRNWILFSVISVFTAAHFICGIFFVADFARNLDNHTLLFSQRRKILLPLANAFATIYTLISACYLSWPIYNGRGGVGLTDTVAEKLWINTVASGAFVSAVQVLNLILCTTLPAYQWWPIHFCTCKIYVITMMVILNVNSAKSPGPAPLTIDMMSETGSVRGQASHRRDHSHAPIEFTPFGQSANELLTSPFNDVPSSASIDAHASSSLARSHSQQHSLPPEYSNDASNQAQQGHDDASTQDGEIRVVTRSREDLSSVAIPARGKAAKGVLQLH